MLISATNSKELSPAIIAGLINGGEACAKAIKLQYVNDQQPGIQRRRKGEDSFEYIFDGKKVKDKETLERIRKLVIPPAWERVWICTKANGHLQVTGYDKLGRKQYKYHPSWSAVRNETKFYRLLHFGKSLSVSR